MTPGSCRSHGIAASGPAFDLKRRPNCVNCGLTPILLRVPALILACALLAGCPPHLKIHVHNDGDNDIRVESLVTQNDATSIRAGRAKVIQAGSVDEVCFELSVGGDVRIYSIDPNSGPYIKSTSYGGRLDFHFADDAMYVRTNTGERVNLSAQAHCLE